MEVSVFDDKETLGSVAAERGA